MSETFLAPRTETGLHGNRFGKMKGGRLDEWRMTLSRETGCGGDKVEGETFGTETAQWPMGNSKAYRVIFFLKETCGCRGGSGRELLVGRCSAAMPGCEAG